VIADVQYLKSKFDEFNRLFFDGKLPEIPVGLSRARSYLGICACKRRWAWFGRREYYDFRIRISTRYELTAEEIEDTLIHEMIHYHIWLNRIKDTSAHGEVFRGIMDRINTGYGRHVTVSRNIKTLNLAKGTPAKGV